MAACDNLYGNSCEWEQLREFLSQNKPEYLIYMRDKPIEKAEPRICYIADIQGWLIENCPLQWVKDRLKENFEVQTMICGQPHHTIYCRECKNEVVACVCMGDENE